MHRTRTASTFLRLAAVFVLATAGIAGASHPASAANLTLSVDTTTDSNDPGYQACSEAPGDCSLRGAISKANADLANTYTIELSQDEVYLLALAGSGEILNAGGDLNIRTSLTINGHGATIDAGGIDRVLRIVTGSVTLNDLTFTGGHAPDGPMPGGVGNYGGGLYISTTGTVTLNRCAIVNNQAGDGGLGLDGMPADGGPASAGGRGGGGGSGGGIYTTGESMNLILNEVTIADNAAGMGAAGGAGGHGDDRYPGTAGGSGGSGGMGGGIYASYQTNLTLLNTTVRGNQAGSGGDGGAGGYGGQNLMGDATNGGAGGAGSTGANGGGIYVSSLIASQSLVYDNVAGDGGAGGAGGDGGGSSINLGGSGGAAGAGNSGGEGGGLYLSSNSTANQLTNVTIASNRAGLGGPGGVGGIGGFSEGPSGPDGPDGASGTNGGGGGIFNSGSFELALNFVTITQNMAQIGAGVKNHGTIFVTNSIIAGNPTRTGLLGDIYFPNTATPVLSVGYNLVSQDLTYDIDTGSDWVITDPAALGLLPLGDNGGATWSIALAAGSPAIGRAACTDRMGHETRVDQRGYRRATTYGCDIGAFEQGCTLAVERGDNQTAGPGMVFSQPLQVSCTPDVSGAPTEGIVVTFSAPASGASLNLVSQTTLVSGDQAQLAVRANSIQGAYTVTASAPGSLDVTFSLVNRRIKFYLPLVDRSAP